MPGRTELSYGGHITVGIFAGLRERLLDVSYDQRISKGRESRAMGREELEWTRIRRIVVEGSCLGCPKILTLWMFANWFGH